MATQSQNSASKPDVKNQSQNQNSKSSNSQSSSQSNFSANQNADSAKLKKDYKVSDDEALNQKNDV